MLSEAQVIERPAQPYVALKEHVTMATIGTVLPGLHGRVSAWLGERGSTPAGAPFWKYNVIDTARFLEVEVGVPSGRYATLRYTGHPGGLIHATEFLLEWAEEHDLTWDVAQTPDGDRWASRLEICETDPAAEPDMSKWVTQLSFRLAN